MIRSVLGALLFSLAFVVTPFISFAQSNDGAGIGISPATIEQPAEPGEVISTDVTIANLSNSRQKYYLFTRDIVGVEAGGVPIFATENQEKTGYELSEWVTLGVTELEFEARSEQTVNITISVPENATPGSHFGAVFVSMEPPRMRSTGAAVAYEVANIISIRVAGDAVENAEIRQFATGNYFYGKPEVDFQARLENKGTVLVRPTGPLEIHNMFGKKVAVLRFNESKAGVFPGSTRDFEIVWEDEGPGFGRYEAVLSLLYGSKGQQATISSTVSFWILPTGIIYPALGVLGVLFLVIFISIKLYLRSKIQYAQTGSRRVVRRRQAQSQVPFALVLIIVMSIVTALFLALLVLLFA